MEWIAYNEDFNRRVIEPINILKNYDDEIKKLKKKSKSYEDFCEQLRRAMMWMYWSKCEYEVLMCVTEDGRVLLKPWVNPRNEDISFDVTNAEDFDWLDFARNYLHMSVPNEDIKIDVFTQIRYKWDGFCKYCWNLGR